LVKRGFGAIEKSLPPIRRRSVGVIGDQPIQTWIRLSSTDFRAGESQSRLGANHSPHRTRTRLEVEGSFLT
jgi:hypothetical protein